MLAFLLSVNGHIILHFVCLFAFRCFIFGYAKDVSGSNGSRGSYYVSTKKNYLTGAVAD